MPYYVVFVKMDNGDVVQVVEAMDRIDQSALHLTRQIDLRHVARNYDFRAVAHARQEHLHLGHGRILAFIQDDDGLIQCAELGVPLPFQLSELIVIRTEDLALCISRELEIVIELAGKLMAGK